MAASHNYYFVDRLPLGKDGANVNVHYGRHTKRSHRGYFFIRQQTGAVYLSHDAVYKARQEKAKASQEQAETVTPHPLLPTEEQQAAYDADLAIRTSIHEARIVTLPHNDLVCGELRAHADDAVQGSTYEEFWGIDDDGCAWRVHVLYAEFNPCLP